MGTPFDDLTTVTRLDGSDDGALARYAGHIDDSWVLRPMPQGGVTTAIAGEGGTPVPAALPASAIRSRWRTGSGQVQTCAASVCTSTAISCAN